MTRPASRAARTSARRGAFFLSLLFLLAAAVGFGSSAAVSVGSGPLTGALPGAEAPKAKPAAPSAAPAGGVKKERTALAPAFEPLAPLFQTTTPSIETYDCTTGLAKTAFTVGERVCARATGAPSGLLFPWRVSFVAPAGYIVQSESAHPDPSTEYDYTLPLGITDTLSLQDGLGGQVSVLYNTRGNWRATLTRASGAIYATAFFSVSDPAAAVADVFVQKFAQRGVASVAAGNPIAFKIIVGNAGPNAAQNVHLADALPQGTSLASFTQESGPTCTPDQNGGCTIESLGARQFAEFLAVYDTSGATVGTALTSATVTTTTAELSADDNTAEARFEITNAGGEASCVLECPNDITTVANATQNNVSGAFVNFAAAESFGDCGAVTASPASGSFFPVGQTTVVVTSAEGGGSCSFVVSVVQDNPPTISCPPTYEATISNACETSVAANDLGTPTTSGGSGNVTVSAARNDGQALGDPFPVGTTTVTWTATDALGRIASCTQLVRINLDTNADTAPPTITAPADLTLSSGTEGGACGLVVNESLLGRAEATDDGCSVTISRSGVPAGNFFPVGTTTITWTATDAAGKTASDTQTVTVVEDTPPTIVAPGDASYSCPNEVPAADPSQARGTDQNLPDGGPPSDNCGVPTVTVTETSSGAGTSASPRVILRTFTATDAAGNKASDVQTITVIDDTPPSITLNGPASVTHECHTAFNDPGASGSDNCQTPSITQSGQLNVDVPGTYTVTYTATDWAGNTATVTRTVTVVDTIAPVITLNGSASVTHECHTAYNDAGAAAADSCDTSVPVTVTGSVDVNTPGTYTLTYTAADDSGNAAAPVTRTVTVVDTTPPVVSCPASVTVFLPLNSTAVSMPVSFTAPTATDSCDTSVPVTTSHAPGSVFPVGPTTVTASATDDSGNSASCSFTVTVLYNFTGFFSPVANPPVLNHVNAGRAIPLKFSLSGNKGLGIFAAGYPLSGAVPCDSSAPLSDLEGTETSGGSTLTYSATSDQYHYNWKTDSSWAGTCRALVVKLNDGSEHTALFKFK